MLKHFAFFPLICLLLAFPLLAQEAVKAGTQSKPIGQFTAAADVGNVQGLNGTVHFDPDSKTYTLKGSGANIWGKEDAFFFVYIPIEGNFEMSVFQTLFNEGKTAHRKAGIMFRETLDADSPCIFITVHGDGLTSLQYREKKADSMAESSYAEKETDPKYLSLERQGDRFLVKTGKDKLDSATTKEKEMKMDKKGFLGIFVSSHSTNDFERASFRNIHFQKQTE